MPLTIVSVWPWAEPVRGRLETILMTLPPLLPQPLQPGQTQERARARDGEEFATIHG